MNKGNVPLEQEKCPQYRGGRFGGVAVSGGTTVFRVRQVIENAGKFATSKDKVTKWRSEEVN